MAQFKPFIPEEFSSSKNKKITNTQKKEHSPYQKKNNDNIKPITTNTEVTNTEVTNTEVTNTEANTEVTNTEVTNTEVTTIKSQNINQEQSLEKNTISDSSALEEIQTFSEEELQIAKAIAYQEGYDKAHEEYKNNTQNKFIEQLNILIQTIQSNIDQKNFHLSALTVHAGDVLITLFRKSLPFFIEKYGTEEIISFLNNTLPNLQDEDSLTFVFSEIHKDSLEKIIPDLLQKNGYQGKYTLLFKQELDPMYIEIIWQFGSLKIDPNLFNQGIEKALSYLKNNNEKNPTNEQTISWNTTKHSNEVAP